jgi:hypothetical protein
MIKSDSGVEITEHEQKTAILWNSFKKRLGSSDDCEMMFDLSNLITPQNLSSLEDPFSTEDIDNIIKCMPNDKAPRLDGFNGLFIKKF